MSCQRLHSRLAFTLIEVLVVVSVIALLVAILLPSLARSRENARSVTCRSNLSQWGKAMMMYADAHDQVLPFEERPSPFPNANGMKEDTDAVPDRVWDQVWEYTAPSDHVKGFICWYDVLDRYIGGGESMMDMKLCPTVHRFDPYREESYRMNSKLADASQTIDNGPDAGKPNPNYKPFRKLDTLRRPAETVLLFDGDLGAGDAMNSPPSFKGRWRFKNAPTDKKDDVNYRHNNSANILFNDGHAETMKKQELSQKSFPNSPVIWMPADMGEWKPTVPES